MRTVYEKASNIIDLAQVRRRQVLDRHDSLARQTGEDLWPPETAPAFRPVVLTATREERRHARRERCAWCLDVCASLAVILTTVAFALWMLL